MRRRKSAFEIGIEDSPSALEASGVGSGSNCSVSERGSERALERPARALADAVFLGGMMDDDEPSVSQVKSLDSVRGLIDD